MANGRWLQVAHWRTVPTLYANVVMADEIDADPQELQYVLLEWMHFDGTYRWAGIDRASGMPEDRHSGVPFMRVARLADLYGEPFIRAAKREGLL